MTTPAKLIPVAAVSLFWAFASVARAEGRNVVIEKFSGPGADKVREAVVASITGQDGYEVVSDRKAASTAKKLDADMTSAGGYLQVAQKLRVVAFVGGTTDGGKKFRVNIWVRNGLDGDVLTEGTFNAPGPKVDRLAEVVGDTFWKRMGLVIGDAKAPAPTVREESETKVAETETAGEGASEAPAAPKKARKTRRSQESEVDLEAEGESDPSESSGRRPVALDVAVGSRVFRRNLTYTDDVRRQLRPYTLGAAPAPGLAIDWYPAAHFMGGPAANIGVSATADYAVALASKGMSGTKYPTSSMAYSVGLRYRLGLGASEASATAAYGLQTFVIKDSVDGTAKPDIPNVAYKFVRVGAGARLALPGGLALLASGAYLVVMSTGEIEEDAYFPRSKAGGVEASVGVAYGLRDGIEVRVGADLRRYFFTMNPDPTDMRVAGGALDQYVAATASLAFRLGNTSE